MLGLTRGFSTLIGAAVAGFLIWLATQFGTETNGDYWAMHGLIAAAGLAIALSQILGGWTKWGWPRLSLGVFLLGFLPVLLVGGWVLLSRMPGEWFNTSAWSSDLGIIGLMRDLEVVLPAISFGIGLTFGLTFDTAGPRTEPVVVDEDGRPYVEEPAPPATEEPVAQHDGRHDRVAADEPITAERETAVVDEPPAEEHRRRGVFRR